MAYRYFIKLAYDGSAYGGWQIQPNTDTVQQSVEVALSTITGIKINIVGCGRTDAGVHAKDFYAHFDSEVAFTKPELEQLRFRLNRFLPHDIVVFEIVPVIPAAHSRFSAVSRKYEYHIINRKDPFVINRAYLIHGKPDVEIMNVCSDLLVGKKDFQCFSKTNTQVNNFFCDVYSAKWIEQNHMLIFKIRADRFLRNMVRAIVGTLLDVGHGKITVAQFEDILQSRNRSNAGFSVPAKGLSLVEVLYLQNIFSDSPVYFLPEGSEKIVPHHDTDAEFHEGSGNESNK